MEEITDWELALYIADKINKIANRMPIIRNGMLDVISVSTEDILRMKPTRKELLFYFERMCK